MSSDEAKFLAEHFVTEHSRTSCDDQDPNNWHSTQGRGDYPRCERCALLKAIEDPDFAKQVRLLHIEIKVPFPYGW